jgi:dienelactone hydrolase
VSTPTVVRRRGDVWFSSGSDECAGWLYVPEGASASGRVPVVVMAHGLGGVKRLRLEAFAERFRGAGYACLVFDYRHFGDSGGEPRELVDIERQLEDWRAAVAFARGVAELDPDRVIAWGTSFAGGHVITIAAGDPRIAAAIAQCPFTDGLASGLVIDPRTSALLTVQALRDLAAELRGRAPVRVRLAAQPGQVGLMTSPDALNAFQALFEASGLTEADMPDRVPARVALDIPRYVPGRRTKDVRCPILFCVCEHDTVAPARATVKHAARAPKGEIRLYDVGHFEIYLGEPFERVVGDQIAFLEAHVPVSAG